MQKTWGQYHLTAKLAEKYSHSTYLVSPIDQPEHQMVLKLYASSLFRFPYEHENLLKKTRSIKKLQHLHLIMPILDTGHAQTGTYHGSITFTKGTANWTVSITYTID